MQLEARTQQSWTLGNASHMDDESLHNARRRMSSLRLDDEKQSLHNVRRRMSTLILEHATLPGFDKTLESPKNCVCLGLQVNSYVH